MRIPNWRECLKRINDKDRKTILNPLEIFVYNNEPAEIADTVQFRNELSDLIEWLLSLESDELGYLKWFAQNADFGPAHGDVMEIMHEQYEKETGLKVPKEWREDA